MRMPPSALPTMDRSDGAESSDDRVLNRGRSALAESIAWHNNMQASRSETRSQKPPQAQRSDEKADLPNAAHAVQARRDVLSQQAMPCAENMALLAASTLERAAGGRKASLQFDSSYPLVWLPASCAQYARCAAHWLLYGHSCWYDGHRVLA